MSLKQGDPKNKGTFVMFKMKPREDEVPSSPRKGPAPRNPSGPVAVRTSGGEESAPLMGKRESSKKSRRAKPTQGAEDDSGCWNDCLRSHCGLRNRKMRNRLVGLHSMFLAHWCGNFRIGTGVSLRRPNMLCMYRADLCTCLYARTYVRICA